MNGGVGEEADSGKKRIGEKRSGGRDSGFGKSDAAQKY